MMNDLLAALGRDRVVSILTSRGRESMEMYLKHHDIEKHIRFRSLFYIKNRPDVSDGF